MPGRLRGQTGNQLASGAAADGKRIDLPSCSFKYFSTGMATHQGGVVPAPDGEPEVAGSAAGDAVDVESAKRSLQALVAAGIHAHDLLGQDDAATDDDDDDDDDEEQNGEEEDSEEEDGEGEDIGEHTGEHNGAYAEGEAAGGDGGGTYGLTSGGDPEHYVAGAGDGGAAGTSQGHQDLIAHVADSLRALIDHGLTTTVAGRAGAGDGYEDGAPLDDDEAYELACTSLENNLRCQRLLRSQLGALEAAQRRNKELQGSIGALLSMQGRASGRRGGRRNKDDRAALMDPVTGEARIMGGMFFVDADGERPPDNRDAVRKQKHPPIVYRTRRWTDAEREALVRGVRQSNRKFLSQRLFQQTKDPRSIWEVEKMSDQELEMPLEGLDWKYISKEFVPQHKPVECAIQWATQDHPIINRAPWTKKEERTLADVVKQFRERDWVAIAKELGTQRTASQCFQVYQRKLNPDMSRSKWTPEEDRMLTEAVMAYGEGDWQAVAACLDNRTGQQVLHRWCKSINPAIRSGRWDKDEDTALLAAVRLYGVGQWTKIAKHVPGRTDVKCRERYMNVLTPDVNNSQWSADEDNRLIAIVNRVGIGKWSYVADLLGGRTDNQCWRHWRSLHKKGRAPDPPEVDDESGEEGTVPSFPEWEEERRRRHRGTAHNDTLLSFAHTQGTGRKRKSMSGIESARKRQWKRATSTNFVPLLASPPAGDSLLSESPPPHGLRTKSMGSLPTHANDDDDAPYGTPTRRPRGRADGNSPLLSPGTNASRRTPLQRRGRPLNWNNILHVGVETKAAGDGANGAAADTDAHTRPVLPCLITVRGLQRLVAAVPEVAAAFNAELVGIDDDDSVPSLDSVAMNWLRQRIESLFIWPLATGTLDTQQKP
ncbi:hypothetical protein LPJ61_003097 [Coemansia biformis]|uniref:Uncharacterized protein n=1 Tax=Coemansia biformis TaxID=1286918 RepID=A0A9W7YD82_9FUNG|nr:hypothetical protein LPJ61_003097 [Coemansia biformis]